MATLEALSRLWSRLPFSIRRRVLFATHHHFLVGVVGVIHNEAGHVLLLDHRFRTPHRWGLPGGFIQHGETLNAGLVRELREELALDVEPGPVVDTELNRSGRYVSIALRARLVNGAPDLSQIGNSEIRGGGFFSVHELPGDTYPHHRRIIETVGHVRARRAPK